MPYNKYLIEQALDEAWDKYRKNENNKLSERFIEAKASIVCLQWVLDLLKDSKNEAVEFGEYLRNNGYMPVNKGITTKHGWLPENSDVAKSTQDVFDDFEKEKMGF